jgi:hypothetical protein
MSKGGRPVHPLLTVALLIVNLYLTRITFFPSFKKNLNQWPESRHSGMGMRKWVWKGAIACIAIWVLIFMSVLDYVGIIDIE